MTVVRVNVLVVLLNAFGMFPQYCAHSISLIIVILSSVHLKALGRMGRIHYSSTFNFLKLPYFLKVNLSLAPIVIHNHSK